MGVFSIVLFPQNRSADRVEEENLARCFQFPFRAEFAAELVFGQWMRAYVGQSAVVENILAIRSEKQAGAPSRNPE